MCDCYKLGITINPFKDLFCIAEENPEFIFSKTHFLYSCALIPEEFCWKIVRNNPFSATESDFQIYLPAPASLSFTIQLFQHYKSILPILNPLYSEYMNSVLLSKTGQFGILKVVSKEKNFKHMNLE